MPGRFAKNKAGQSFFGTGRPSCHLIDTRSWRYAKLAFPLMKSRYHSAESFGVRSRVS